MNQKMINKITKQMYPSSAFSRKERIRLRQAAKEGIAEYLTEHPDAVYDEILQHYTDGNELTAGFKSSLAHTTITIVCIGIILAIICGILYYISNTWEPPTYYL